MTYSLESIELRTAASLDGSVAVSSPAAVAAHSGADVLSLSLGTILALSCTPVLWGVVRNRAVGLLLATAALCVLSSVVLIHGGSGGGREFEFVGVRTALMLLLGLTVHVAAVFWSGRRVGIIEGSLLYGGSATVVALLTSGVSENSWKYALGVPVTLVILTVLGRASRSWVVVGCLLLAGVSLALATRNTAGAVLIAAAAYVIYSRSSGATSLWKFVLGAMALIIFGVAVYDTVLAVASTGVFGEALQRTVQLQAESGAPIAGRVEYGATWALSFCQPSRSRAGGYSVTR